MDYQTTAVIRQRGQLTMPEEIRKIADWLNKDKVVSVQFIQNSVIVKPYSKMDDTLKARWEKAAEMMAIAHSFKTGVKNVSSLIAEDRER